MTNGETAYLALSIGAIALFFVVVLIKGLPYLDRK